MKIGAHESISGGIYKSIERAVADECEALQVFVKNSNRWTGKAISDAEADTFRRFAADFGAGTVSAHASYLINLCAQSEETYEKSLAGVHDELTRCDLLNIPYYVIHPGSHTGAGEEAGIAKIVESIDAIYTEHCYNTVLLLETTAGQGSNIGYRLEQIEEIISRSRFSDKLGVCLDSCHMFTAGYDFKGNYDTVVTEIFSRFGDKVKVFHINDSKKPLGSRLDRHELIGQGEIGLEFFRNVVNDPRFDNVLGILETPIAENYLEEVRLLKSLRRA